MMETLTMENSMAFCLQLLKKEEVDQARLLCDSCVGENLYSKEEITAAIGASDRFFYLLKSEKGEAVGYIYYYLTDEEPIAKYARLDTALFREVYDVPEKKVGKIQSVGLKPEYRGTGLAAQMIGFALRQLKERGIEAAFIVCWKPDGVIPLKKALAACGFTFLSEAKMVWYDDAELICPYCKGRCLCDAEVYYQLLMGDMG